MVAPHRQDDGTAGILRQIREMLGTRSRSNVSIPMLPTPKIGFALWWASLILYMTHLVHTKALPPVPKETLYTYYTLDAIRQKLWETDWVTPAIFWTFLFGTFYLLGVWLTKYRLLANAESTDVYNKVMSGELDSVKHKIEAAADPAQLGYYGARLHALVTRWNEDSDLPAVQALKNEILEIDEQNLAHSFVPVMWSESALPLLGFLGTVIGIGQAIGSISEAIKILLKSATSTTLSSTRASRIWPLRSTPHSLGCSFSCGSAFFTSGRRRRLRTASTMRVASTASRLRNCPRAARTLW